MSLTTTWRWMGLLGLFIYNTKEASSYVDGHKRDDVIDARSIFYRSFSTDNEPYCKRLLVQS